MQGLIDEHRQRKAGSSSPEQRKKTIVEALLSLQEAEPEYYTDDILKGIILVSVFTVFVISLHSLRWQVKDDISVQRGEEIHGLHLRH